MCSHSQDKSHRTHSKPRIALFLHHSLDMLPNTRYILVLLFYMILITQCSGCYTQVLKTSQLGIATCTLCFHLNSSYQNCSISGETGISDTDCRNTCCVLNYSVPLPNTCNPSTSSSSGTSLNLATILIIVFFSIPVIICMLALIHSCILNRNRTPTVARTFREDPPVSEVNLADYNMDELYPYHINTKENCSICLDDQCNIVTLCGHPYHSTCFAIWVHKRHKCPLCVSQDFNPIATYCTKCSLSTKLTLLYKTMSPEEVRDWITNSVACCQRCQHPHMEEEEVQISLGEQEINRYLQWKKLPLKTEALSLPQSSLLPNTQSLEKITKIESRDYLSNTTIPNVQTTCNIKSQKSQK